MAGNNLAVVYALEKIIGTIKGQKSELCMRVTSVFQEINGKWLDVHDHVSVPVDFETAKAMLDLKP